MNKYIPCGLKMTNEYSKKFMSRQMLEYINSFNGRKYNDNYFYWFIRLLSEAVSQDITNDWVKKQSNIDKPNLYTYHSRLSKVWGVKKSEVNGILSFFADAGLIVYSAQKRPIPFKESKIFIRFKRFYDYLPPIERVRGKADVESHLFNIKHNRGYIYFPAKSTTEFFFNKIHYSHGIKDLALLLYCNTIFNDDLENNNDIKNTYLVNFGGYITDYTSTVIQNRYIKLQSFAEYLQIPFSALNEMLMQMQRKGFLKKYYIRNKGTSIILSCLENESKKGVKEIIRENILSVSDRTKKVVFSKRDFLNRVVLRNCFDYTNNEKSARGVVLNYRQPIPLKSSA